MMPKLMVRDSRDLRTSLSWMDSYSLFAARFSIALAVGTLIVTPAITTTTIGSRAWLIGTGTAVVLLAFAYITLGAVQRSAKRTSVGRHKPDGEVIPLCMKLGTSSSTTTSETSFRTASQEASDD